jgi:hypothetical protein
MKKILLLFILFVSLAAYGGESQFSESFQTQTEQQAPSEQIILIYLNGQLTVENAPINSKIEVFTMLGVSIFRNVVTDSKQVFLVDLEKGYYIIKVAGLTKKISVK